MDAFRMGIKSKDDLRRYSLEELEKMCPKDKRLFVRLKKLKAIYGWNKTVLPKNSMFMVY